MSPRTTVKILSTGAVAQLVERSLSMREAEGSIPSGSIIASNSLKFQLYSVAISDADHASLMCTSVHKEPVCQQVVAH